LGLRINLTTQHVDSPDVQRRHALVDEPYPSQHPERQRSHLPPGLW